MTAFAEWLHDQSVSDTTGRMPYADCYHLGPLIEKAIGTGEFDFTKIAAVFRAEFADDEAALAANLEALTKAEGGWRMDMLCYTLPDEIEEASKAVEHVPKALTGVIPPMPCGFRNVDGSTCSTGSVEGSARCARHGGAIVDPEVRRSLLMISYAKVIQGSEVAVDALLEVAEHGRSEMARVQAAKELLDRAGVVQDQHVHLHAPDDGIHEDDILAGIRDRLEMTKDRLKLVAIPVRSIEAPPATGTDG